MPMHDWSRVPDGLNHHFHQQWTVQLCNALNAGILPSSYYALIEQKTVGVIPDVLTWLKPGRESVRKPRRNGGTLVKPQPAARFITQESDRELYAAKANRVAVRNDLGELAAVIEFISPGNKHSKAAIQAFVDKVLAFLHQGVNLLIVDPFPPTRRDPAGIHKKIWDDIREEPFELPKGKRLTVVAYQAGPPKTAYIEPIGVGDRLPDMPLFIAPGDYVLVPLEETYTSVWRAAPQPFQNIITKAGTKP